MRKTASQNLKEWFDGQGLESRKEILHFVYGDAYVEELHEDGLFCGPADPGILKKGGLFCGPAPSSTTGRCPTCGRPY